MPTITCVGTLTFCRVAGQAPARCQTWTFGRHGNPTCPAFVTSPILASVTAPRRGTGPIRYPATARPRRLGTAAGVALLTETAGRRRNLTAVTDGRGLNSRRHRKTTTTAGRDTWMLRAATAARSAAGSAAGPLPATPAGRRPWRGTVPGWRAAGAQAATLLAAVAAQPSPPPTRRRRPSAAVSVRMAGSGTTRGRGAGGTPATGAAVANLATRPSIRGGAPPRPAGTAQPGRGLVRRLRRRGPPPRSPTHRAAIGPPSVARPPSVFPVAATFPWRAPSPSVPPPSISPVAVTFRWRAPPWSVHPPSVPPMAGTFSRCPPPPSVPPMAVPFP